MIPKIRCTVLLVFIVFVKHIAPLRVYVLEGALQKRPSKPPTSIYLKPIVKSDPSAKKTFCQRVGIICLAPIQNSKDVLRGREDSREKDTKSSSYSEEHSDSASNDSDNDHHPTIFDDLTRVSHEKTKASAENKHTLQIRPVKLEDTGIDINKLTKDRGYYEISGRRLAKIVKKKPKISKISTNTKEGSDDESDDDDEEEEEKVKMNAKTEEESESGEDETNANDNASPETEEQDKPKKGQKSTKKLAEAAKKKKIEKKLEKKFKTPKRFEVVDNGDGESEEPKKNTKKGKEDEDSDEKADGKDDDKSDESGNPAPEDIDLTDIVEKSSIETTTEKLVLENMKDDKEKYTYIQGLHRKVQVGNKQESEEDEEPPEKTAEEDIGLLYRRASNRLPYFLPKRYIWDEDDYRNLGYFWFNGPAGQSPGNYRIRYKK